MPSDFQVITSAQNPRVKNLVRLRDARHRRRSGYFLIEGERELSRAIATGWELTTLFFAPEQFRTPASMDLVEDALERKVEVIQLSADAFAKVAYREGPDGLLALAPNRETTLEALPMRDPAFILVAAEIEKPGNLGALIRTANAAGVDALVVCDPVCDLFNPNAIRASQGAFFDLPIAVADAGTVQAWLLEKGIAPVATTPSTDAELWDFDLRQPVAIVMGAEDIGLADSWMEPPSLCAKLPMAGITDSLNVSVTAGIALFEVVRQRRG